MMRFAQPLPTHSSSAPSTGPDLQRHKSQLGPSELVPNRNGRTIPSQCIDLIPTLQGPSLVTTARYLPLKKQTTCAFCAKEKSRKLPLIATAARKCLRRYL